MAKEYISQVSEEIEGWVNKKLSKEFSRTESRILGALSKLNEFLLNPQVRICSVAVPGTSRNSNSENREPTGDRSLDDPCPEARFSFHHSGNLNSSEHSEYLHSTHQHLKVSEIFVKWILSFYSKLGSNLFWTELALFKIAPFPVIPPLSLEDPLMRLNCSNFFPRL